MLNGLVSKTSHCGVVAAMPVAAATTATTNFANIIEEKSSVRMMAVSVFDNDKKDMPDNSNDMIYHKTCMYM